MSEPKNSAPHHIYIVNSVSHTYRKPIDKSTKGIISLAFCEAGTYYVAWLKV